MGILYGTGQVLQDLRVGRATYDFATHAGAAGNVTLGTIIPKGAVVILVAGSCNETILPATAKMTINIGAVEVLAATLVNDATITGAGSHYTTPPLEILVDSEVNIDISVDDYTVGNYDIFVKYYMGTGNDSV